MSYTRFAEMIVASTVVMFGLMYLNTCALEHVEFSQTRMWMALVMGAVMAVIMLGFMGAYTESRRHYRDPRRSDRGLCRCPVAGSQPGDGR